MSEEKAKILSCLVEETGCLSQSSIGTGIPRKQVLAPVKECSALEQMNLPEMVKASGQNTKVSFFHGLLCGLPPQGVAQMQGGSSYFKRANQEKPLQEGHHIFT